MARQNWSMDAYFINNVNALIQKYIDADFSDNMEEMFKALKNLELICSPKIEDLKAEHTSINWIRDNMHNIFVYDMQTGKIRGTNPQNMNQVKKVLDETYRSILMKLEAEKIYTGETTDKNRAMGNFRWFVGVYDPSWNMKKQKGHWKWNELPEKIRQKIGKARIGLPPAQKGKTYEEFYGNSIGNKLRKNLKNMYLGKTYEELHGIKFAEDIKKRKSVNMIGKNVGKKRTKETINKIKAARANQVFPVKDTLIEVKIQEFLKELNIEYFAHHYIKDIEHAYQCDIWIPSLNLVIECDGEYWHNYPLYRDIDNIRTKELKDKGVKVIRLWGKEIDNLENSQDLLKIIKQ